MERYALLHRIQFRRRIAQRMRVRQPLHMYIGNHRLLSPMLRQTTNQSAALSDIDGWLAALSEHVQQEDALPPQVVMEEERADLPVTPLSPIAPADIAHRPGVGRDGVGRASLSGGPAEGGTPSHNGQPLSPLPLPASIHLILPSQGLSNVQEQTMPISSPLPAEQPSTKTDIVYADLAMKDPRTPENAPQVARMPNSAILPVLEPIRINQAASSSASPVTPSPAQDESLYPQVSTDSQPPDQPVQSPIVDNIAGSSVQMPSQYTDYPVTEQRFAPSTDEGNHEGRDPVLPRPRFINPKTIEHLLAFNANEPITQPSVYIAQQEIPQAIAENNTTDDIATEQHFAQLNVSAIAPTDLSDVQQGRNPVLPRPRFIDPETIEHPLISDPMTQPSVYIAPHEISQIVTENSITATNRDRITAAADTDTNSEEASNTPPTHNDGERHPTAPDLERPLARRKERTRQRRRSMIEERSSSAGFISPSTEEQGSTSAAQATTPSQLDVISRRLTPQETKAALAALVPSQDTPQSSSEWLALLQQSKWSNGNKNTEAPTSELRMAPTPNAQFGASNEHHRQATMSKQVAATNANEPLTREASRISQHVPVSNTPPPALAGVPLQSPSVPFVPPLPGGIAPTTPAEQHTNSTQQRPQPLAHSDGPTATIAALDPQTAEPVPQRARLFLHPLTGIDPAEINLYRGAVATEIVNAYQADAIAVGDSVLIAGKNSIDTPETLGLLAHELTHVARQRTAYTVPPIIANPQRNIYPYPHMSSTLTPYAQIEPLAPPTPTLPSTWSTSKSEEHLAQEVEQRVIVQAQDTVQQNNHQPSHNSGRTSTERGREQEETFAPSLEWGGLPAPWEPLPNWLTATPAQEPGTSTTNQPPPASARVPISASPFKSEMGETPASAVQRAATERTSGTIRHADTNTSQAQPETPTVPKPDMDLLAQQVYQLLKRRLDVERRRMK